MSWATLQLPHHTAAANTPNTLVIDQVSHLTTWGWGTYNKRKISIFKYFISMWHTFNCHIWVPNVNIIKDLHTVYSKAAHVLHAPPLVTTVTGVAAAVSVFTTVSLVYKVAPYCPASPLTLKTITFLLCSAVSRLLASPSWSSLYSLHCAQAASTRDPETTATTSP